MKGVDTRNKARVIPARTTQQYPDTTPETGNFKPRLLPKPLDCDQQVSHFQTHV